MRRSRNTSSGPKEPKGDKLEFDGVVQEALPNAMFRVQGRQRTWRIGHDQRKDAAVLHQDPSRVTALLSRFPRTTRAAGASRTATNSVAGFEEQTDEGASER